MDCSYFAHCEAVFIKNLKFITCFKWSNGISNNAEINKVIIVENPIQNRVSILPTKIFEGIKENP